MVDWNVMSNQVHVVLLMRHSFMGAPHDSWEPILMARGMVQIYGNPQVYQRSWILWIYTPTQDC